MSTYDSVDDLLDILDRHVGLLLAQDDSRLLVGLPRFLDVLLGDPRLESVVSELSDVATVREQAFARRDVEILETLRMLWRKEKALFTAAAAAADQRGDREIFDAHIAFSNFVLALRKGPPEGSSLPKELTTDPGHSAEIVSTLDHWLSWCPGTGSSEEGKKVSRVARSLRALGEQCDYNYRRMWFDSRTLGGLAYRRLETRAKWLNLDPADTSSDAVMGRHAIRSYWKPITDAVMTGSSSASADMTRLQTEANAVRRDIAILHLEVRSALLSRRSKLALLKRFQARCERFDAAEFRALANDQKAGEAALTLNFARFLFDEGLDPLVDPTIGNLRPDLFVPLSKTPVYVEAKQYGKKGDSPRERLKKALGQVFDTWGRLRATHPLEEAFLAVFRRGGRRIEMPEVIRVHGRTLYAILIDLVEANEAGSQQKHAPSVIQADEMIEWAVHDVSA